MSCCLILQNKDGVCIGADSATSMYVEELGNQFFRSSNNGKKLFEVGKDIVFCSGDMSEVPDVVRNMKTKDGYIDLEHISRYLKDKEFRKRPAFDFPSIAVLICRVVGGNSYMYSLEEDNNFDIVTHIGSDAGVQVWVGGIYNEKCLEIATEEMKRLKGDAVNVYINTYKRMACQEIGGNINVYYVDAGGHRKIIEDYDLNDGYAPVSFSRGLVHGIVAKNLVGELMASNSLYITNENGSVLITGDGIRIDKGTIKWGGVNPPEIGNIDGLADSLKEIEGSLDQLDGRIQTYSQPSTDDPKKSQSTGWPNEDDPKHNGDVWLATDTGIAYVYAKSGGTWGWVETQDSKLKSLAQSKAQVFTSKAATMSEGYGKGDLWILESDTAFSGRKKGTILTAVQSASPNNAFHADHWQEPTVRDASDALSKVDTFRQNVNKLLNADVSTTEIGSDYVFSPHIGGGYLYIKDARKVGNTGIGVEVNPSGTEFAGHNGDYVFSISKNNGSDLIMGVKNNGSGYFSGEVTASSGTIGKWDIKNDKISCADSSQKGITLDAGNKSIISKSDNRTVTLSSGSIKIEGEDAAHLSMYGASWNGGKDYGACLVSDKASKFACFGYNDTDVTGSDTWTPKLILNYGLNPSGHTQDVISYGSGYFSGDFTVGGNLYAYEATKSIGTNAPNLMIDGVGKISGTSGSSRRFKDHILPLESKELNPHNLYDIDVVQYKFKKDYLSEEDQRYDKDVIGFIAEDIYEKYPVAADYSIGEDGKAVVKDWNFRYVVPAMLKLIQEQKEKLDALEREIKELKK